MIQFFKERIGTVSTPQVVLASLLAAGFLTGYLTKPELFRVDAPAVYEKTLSIGQESLPGSLRGSFQGSLTGSLPDNVGDDGIFQPLHNAELMKIGHYKVGKPYNIKGKKYHPKASYNHTQTGLASWYGPGFHGKKTANGEIFDMYSVSAAHTTLQIPCVVKVTNLDNNRELLVRINDRGPFHDDPKGERVIDLSYGAAKKLGFVNQGVARVKVEVMPEQSMMLAAACQNRSKPSIQLASHKVSEPKTTIRQAIT